MRERANWSLVNRSEEITYYRTQIKYRKNTKERLEDIKG